LIEFTHRTPNDAERLVSDYETFVIDLATGYGMSVYEYANDLFCRQSIEESKTSPEI